MNFLLRVKGQFHEFENHKLLECKIETWRGSFATNPNPKGDYVIWPYFNHQFPYIIQM